MPTEEEIRAFFRRIRSLAELDTIAGRINALLGPMDIVHPRSAISIILPIPFRAAATRLCQVQFPSYEKPDSEIGGRSPDADRSVSRALSGAGAGTVRDFRGNHRGLGIDFELFTSFVEQIRIGAGMSEGRVFTFCNAEDVLRLNDQYGMKELERRMLKMGCI